MHSHEHAQCKFNDRDEHACLDEFFLRYRCNHMFSWIFLCLCFCLDLMFMPWIWYDDMMIDECKVDMRC